MKVHNNHINIGFLLPVVKVATTKQPSEFLWKLASKYDKEN